MQREVWKIEEDFKFFEKTTDSDDSISVSANAFNEVIGDFVPTNETNTHNGDNWDLNPNLYAYYMNDGASVDGPMQAIKPKMPEKMANVQKTTENLEIVKKFRCPIVPNLSHRQRREIQTFASIYLDSAALTWTSFRVDRNAEESKISVIASSHINTTYDRVHSADMLSVLEGVVQNIPNCDAYIIENMPLSFHTSIAVRQIKDMMQNNQIISIVASLLSTRNKAKSYINHPNVIFMGRGVMGKCYNLFIGRETVSTENVVREILNKKNLASNDHVHRDITFEPEIIRSFEGNMGSQKVKREYLGKTLLIGITFFRLVLLVK